MLNSKQKKCAALMAMGRYTQKEIAKELTISEATICNWKKTDEFMEEYNAALKAIVKDVAAKAFKTETDLLMARSEMVRLMAAKDILDRAGFKPEDKVKMEGTQTVTGKVSLHRIDLSCVTDEELAALDEITGKIFTE